MGNGSDCSSEYLSFNGIRVLILGIQRHVHILEFHPDTTNTENINKARRDQLKLDGGRQNWQAYNVAMFTEHVSRIIEHDSLRTPSRTMVICKGITSRIRIVI